MLQNLKRIREPLAWALLATAAASIGWTITQVLVYVEWSGDPTMLYWLAGMRLLEFEISLALVAAAWACAVPPAVKRARAIAAVGGVITLVATLATGMQLVVAWSSITDPLDFVGSTSGGVLDLMIGVIASVALWALVLPARPAVVDPAWPAPDDGTPEVAEQPAVSEPPASVWSRDEAVGTAWRSADEAAAGAPGSQSVDPSEQRNPWGPAPD